MESRRRQVGVANADASDSFASFPGADSLIERHTPPSRMLAARVETPPATRDCAEGRRGAPSGSG
eukprot:5753666-Prymnesium_polylepis.1